MRHDGKRCGRQQTAEPAVTDVVGQGHGGVADTCREHLYQHGGNRAVDHGHQQHQVGQNQNNHRLVDLHRVGLGGITGCLQGCAQVGSNDCVPAFLFIRQIFQSIFGFFHGLGIDHIGGLEVFQFFLGGLLGCGHIFWRDNRRDHGFADLDDGRGAGRGDFIGIADRVAGQFLFGDIA